MKRLFVILLLLVSLLALAGCGKESVVHCDRCGAEIVLPAGSRITEDWIVFCKQCEAEIGPVVEP